MSAALERFGDTFNRHNSRFPSLDEMQRRFQSGRTSDLLSPAEVHRLVQGTKCPTRPEGVLRLEKRDWSNEYRIRYDAVLAGSGDPPVNVGDRVTSELSPRGARALADSCAYVSAKLGGYRTFLTLTLDADRRAALDRRRVKKTGRADPGEKVGGAEAIGSATRVRWEWENSLQREASRFFDGMSKMYQRGFVPAYFRGGRRETKKGNGEWYTPIRWNVRGIKVEAHGDAARLPYCWVAENPVNEEGERNPHIHVLLAWSVPYSVFPQWAYRVERGIWKQGFAHLEKLKEHKAAGYYMAKAAGYLTKAQGDNDQGPIRGNRYGIGSVARAPGWYQVDAWAADACGEIIKRARIIHAQRTAQPRQQRDNLKAALTATPKEEKRKRQRIGRALERARAKLDTGWYVTKFGVVLRGLNRLDAFVSWMKQHGWQETKRGASYAFAVWTERREALHEMRAAWRRFYAGLRGDCDEHWQALRDMADRWEPVEFEEIMERQGALFA